MKNKIKELREDLNISQKQLAHLVNISVYDLKDIEDNKLCPSLITAHNIAKTLKKDSIADVFIFEE